MLRSENFEELLGIFFEENDNHHNKLEKVLLECGWEKVKTTMGSAQRNCQSVSDDYIAGVLPNSVWVNSLRLVGRRLINTY